MDVTQLLNNYLDPYIHASLGSKASNDTHRITIYPSAPQERNSATNNCSSPLISKESYHCQFKAILSHAITNKSRYIYIYLTTLRQSETNSIALILNLKI